MKKIIKIILLLTLTFSIVSILEITSAENKTQKEALENNVNNYKKEIDKNLLKTIDAFIEKNKEKKEYLNSLKNKITEFKKKSSSLSNSKKNLIKYLEAKTDLAIFNLSQKEEKLEKEEKLTKTEETKKKESQKILIVNNSFLNVRQGPSTSYKKIEEVHIGDKLILLEEKNDWCKIITPKGTNGRVSKIYVIEENKTDNITNETELGKKVVKIAKKYLGTPYKLGEETPEKGFDCSGFVYYVFKEAGKNLGRTSSKEMSKIGVSINKNDLEIGDLLFFKYYGGKDIAHVGIYIGNNKIIHSTPGEGVTTVDLDSSYYLENYVTAKRIKN